MRTITGAISRTTTAGSNYFNAGRLGELATKEIDYFVYLCWDSTDSAVRILFSRIPSGNTWADFRWIV